MQAFRRQDSGRLLEAFSLPLRPSCLLSRPGPDGVFNFGQRCRCWTDFHHNREHSAGSSSHYNFGRYNPDAVAWHGYVGRYSDVWTLALRRTPSSSSSPKLTLRRYLPYSARPDRIALYYQCIHRRIHHIRGWTRWMGELGGAF